MLLRSIGICHKGDRLYRIKSKAFFLRVFFVSLWQNENHLLANGSQPNHELISEKNMNGLLFTCNRNANAGRIPSAGFFRTCL
jgi:hypothetical protein